MKIYQVVTSNGNDEWLEYEGTYIMEAKRVARKTSWLNERTKQKHTVELREMADDYEPGSDIYNYGLIEY